MRAFQCIFVNIEHRNLFYLIPLILFIRSENLIDQMIRTISKGLHFPELLKPKSGDLLLAVSSLFLTLLMVGLLFIQMVHFLYLVNALIFYN